MSYLRASFLSALVSVPPSIALAAAPSLSSYIRDTSGPAYSWEQTLSTDSADYLASACAERLKNSGQRGMADALILLDALQQTMEAALSSGLMLAYLKQISRSEQVYAKMAPLIDKVGEAWHSEFAKFQWGLSGPTCETLEDYVRKGAEMHLGFARNLYPLVEVYAETFGLENDRYLLGARPAPLIADLDVLSPEAAMERSRGGVLLQVGPAFDQTFLDTLVRNLAGAGVEPDLVAAQRGNTLRLYFYNNEVPRGFAAVEIADVKALTLELLEQYKDEIASMEAGKPGVARAPDE